MTCWLRLRGVCGPHGRSHDSPAVDKLESEVMQEIQAISACAFRALPATRAARVGGVPADHLGHAWFTLAPCLAVDSL